jgi:hypothetical protein
MGELLWVDCAAAAGVCAAGETLVVSMWATSPTIVVFQTTIKERPGAVAISGAAVEFHPDKLHVPGLSKL